MKKKWIFWITMIIILLIIFFYLRSPIVVKNTQVYNLQDDGFCIYKKLIDSSTIRHIQEMIQDNKSNQVKEEIINNDRVKSKLLKNLSPDYGFQDYIFIIKKSAIHTCHRDANGLFFNEKIKHPTYTLLIFLESMEDSLGVIPKSHKDIYEYSVNFSNNVKTFKSNPGDAILFNANLIHVGGINEKNDNLRLQFKLCHYEDNDKLDYYNGYNKMLSESNSYPQWIRKIQKNMSCFVPGISDLTQDNIQSDAQNDTTSSLSQLFSQLFYGNKDFYNLTTI